MRRSGADLCSVRWCLAPSGGLRVVGPYMGPSSVPWPRPLEAWKSSRVQRSPGAGREYVSRCWQTWRLRRAAPDGVTMRCGSPPRSPQRASGPTTTRSAPPGEPPRTDRYAANSDNPHRGISCPRNGRCGVRLQGEWRVRCHTDLSERASRSLTQLSGPRRVQERRPVLLRPLGYERARSRLTRSHPYHHVPT